MPISGKFEAGTEYRYRSVDLGYFKKDYIISEESTMLRTVIIGAGEWGKVVLDILQDSPDVKVAGFLDDNKDVNSLQIAGIPVLGDFKSLSQIAKNCRIEAAIVAIGNNSVRASIFERIKKTGMKPINAIHETALIGKNVQIGQGVSIVIGAVINIATVIGDNVIIGEGAILSHHCTIKNHVHIAPDASLAAGVTVGEGADIGIGAIILDHLVIGRNATVGGGAVVIEDVPVNAVVVGVPAKVIKYKSG